MAAAPPAVAGVRDTAIDPLPVNPGRADFNRFKMGVLGWAVSQDANTPGLRAAVAGTAGGGAAAQRAKRLDAPRITGVRLVTH